MDRYQRVEKRKPESPINENEIRITSQGLIRNYVSYATTLLQEKRMREIVLKAMGQAISKTVAIAERIKKTIPRLHQDTAISSVSITDVWEPIEEGLVPVEMTRHVSMITIALSTREIDKTSPGYQAPHNAEQSRPQYYQQQQPRQARVPYNVYNEESYGRGRGRSWRGGYGNYQGGGNYEGGNYYGANYEGGNYYGGNYEGGNYRSRNYDGGNYRGGNYQGGNYQGGNYQDTNYNGGYSNRGRGGRGRGWGYGGAGYERGRGGVRGYNRGRGRTGGRSRGGGRGSGDQA